MSVITGLVRIRISSVSRKPVGYNAANEASASWLNLVAERDDGGNGDDL